MKVIVRKVKGSRADGVFVPEYGFVGLVDGQAIIDMPEDKQEKFVNAVNGLAKYEVEVLEEKPIIIEVSGKPIKEEEPKEEPVKEEKPIKEEKPKEEKPKKAEKKPAKKTPAKKRTTRKRR